MHRIVFLFILLSLSATAQFPVHLETGAGAYLNSGNSPFYLRSNKYGVVPKDGNVAYLYGRVSKDYDSTNKKMDYGFVFEPYFNAGKSTEFLLPEAFVKAKYRAIEFYGGRRREIVGLTDTLLTSGSYIWSGNAMPLWKVQAGIPEYLPILKNGLISIKGAIAHGWFDRGRPVTKNVKLHQKWAYVRLGKPTWKTHIFAGFNHQAQWGGESPFYSVDGKLPDGLSNFPYVFFGTRNPDTNAPISSVDGENRIGNHLGTIDLGLDLFTNFGKITLYRQNIYEDGSLFFFNNIADGLNGITLNLKNQSWISRINIEYLNTTSQGGEIFLMGPNIPDELRGKDNYFNHAQYRDGWTYKRNVIGAPFIQTIGYEWDNPEYQIDQNRVKMWQGATSGNLPWYHISYRMKIAYATYLGTYQFPQTKRDQTSLALFLSGSINSTSKLGLEAGYDTGSLAPRTAGISISYIKHWK